MYTYLLENRVFIRTSIVVLSLIINSHVGAQALSELADVRPSVALSKANEILEQNPNDEESLFFRARALKNLGKIDQAKEIYQLLIKRRPQSPEPYLNLAAIYSEKGDIEQAQQTLIQGLNANEGYAKLYKGLKNINGQLAAQAYMKALNKEVKEQTIDLGVAKNIDIPKPIFQEKEVIKEVPVEVVKEVIKEVPVAIEAAKLETIRETPVEQNKQIDAELDQIVKEWAKAWSAQNVAVFTSFYTASYIPENSSMSHKAWLRDRQLKISNKTFISVSVDDLKQRVRDDGKTDVILTQTYRSNTVSDTIKKQLSFVKEAGKWRIFAERVIGR